MEIYTMAKTEAVAKVKACTVHSGAKPTPCLTALIMRNFQLISPSVAAQSDTVRDNGATEAVKVETYCVAHTLTHTPTHTHRHTL